MLNATVLVLLTSASLPLRRRYVSHCPLHSTILNTNSSRNSRRRPKPLKTMTRSPSPKAKAKPRRPPLPRRKLPKRKTLPTLPLTLQSKKRRRSPRLKPSPRQRPLLRKKRKSPSPPLKVARRPLLLLPLPKTTKLKPKSNLPQRQLVASVKLLLLLLTLTPTPKSMVLPLRPSRRKLPLLRRQRLLQRLRSRLKKLLLMPRKKKSRRSLRLSVVGRRLN